MRSASLFAFQSHLIQNLLYKSPFMTQMAEAAEPTAAAQEGADDLEKIFAE